MSAASPISLLVSDVDGTLVTRDKVLTARATKAVAGLKAAGARFAITSGRPPLGMKMFIDPLAIDTPVAGFNGGLLANPDLSPIEERRLPADVAHAILERIASAGLDAWLYAGNDWLVHDRDAPHVAREQTTVQFAPQVVADFADRIGAAVKIVGVSDDAAAIRQCGEDIRAAFGDKVAASLSQPYYLDVTHPRANKGDVVRDLSRRLGIPAHEIATIGDSANDVAMFEAGGFAIAMGNADDTVKAAADTVTADCDAEGFAEAIETIILPRVRGRS